MQLIGVGMSQHDTSVQYIPWQTIPSITSSCIFIEKKKKKKKKKSP
jgi:hypothetical protein